MLKVGQIWELPCRAYILILKIETDPRSGREEARVFNISLNLPDLRGTGIFYWGKNILEDNFVLIC